MESQLSNLNLSTGSGSLPKKKIASNVYKVRTAQSAVVHRYCMSFHRMVNTDKGTVSKDIKPAGPDALRIIRSRVTREALHVIMSSSEYKDITVIYDHNETIYSNRPLTTQATLTKMIDVSSLDVSGEDKRMVLRNSTIITVTIKADSGFNNIHSSIQACHSEDIDLIKFYSTLLRSAAPSDRFIGLRGGRLFDITTLKGIGAGMERARGIRMGTKYIGEDVLSVALDIDSKEGCFFKPQPLLNSIQDYFKCSESQLRNKIGDYKAMKQMERFIRGTPVRMETNDHVFNIAGLKWEVREEGESTHRFLQKWDRYCKTEELRKYCRDPVVLEENVSNTGTIDCHYYPLSALHILPYSRVPLSKQDKIERPRAIFPNVRYDLIERARGDIRIDTQNEFLEGFETEIATQPVYPMSEILRAPEISAGRMNRLQIDLFKHNYNSNPNEFVVPAHITCFHVVYDLREMSDKEMAKQFFDALGRVCTMKGLRTDSAEYHGVSNEIGLEERLAWLSNERREREKGDGRWRTVIVLCIGFKDEHDSIKYLEYKFKVLTQHVMKATMEKVLRNGKFETDKTLHNIMKKINEKCGGTNVEVTPPTECASLFPARTGPKSAVSLIIGMDVCHGDPISRSQEIRGYKPDPSIIGISSNALTDNPQKYTGDFIPTQGRKEAVPDQVMSDHGKFLMAQFLENHGRLPDNVILVRDGVSRSQYDMALGEYNALMEGVRSAVDSSDFKPRELLLIVTKEHNLRLFDKKNGKVCNVAPGTVVDSGIVSPFMPEFIIIPHDAFSGTAKGVLVTVRKDGEKDLRKYPCESLNEIKFFIHSLCFLHGICDNPSGSPEPVSVSHDLAERGMNLAKELRFRTESRLEVEELKKQLMARGTSFQGVKFTA